jgi:hypothetical protein
MFSGPPLPLPPDFPLRQLLLLLSSEHQAGAWFRGSTRSVRLHGRSNGCCSGVLLAPDLGFLLRLCSGVVVREGANAVLLDSELLIQWRALQVVTGTPYLPCPHRLKELFPDSEIDALGFQVPTRSCPPEAVLADCLTHGIPVAQSRIIYRAPANLPVDATQPAPLR